MDFGNISIIYHRHNKMTPFFAIPQRTCIKFYDLTLLMKGEMKYKVNGETVMLKAHDIIFIPYGTIYSRQASEEKADYISFNFTTKNPIINWKIHMKDVIDPIIRQIVAIYDEVSREASDTASEKCTHLLYFLLLKLYDMQSSDPISLAVLKIKQYLKDNLSKKISLSQIAEKNFFSPIYCETIFKKETGKSIIDYLICMRIEEAKSLLAEKIFSLSDIASEVGFDDYNYFSRTFKKRTGYTPKEYQQLT